MNALHLLEPGIWYRDVALGEYDVRGLLIVGDRKAVVWDTLSNPRDMSGYPEVIGNRELAIVYSHADWDHVWGTAGLPYEHARIVGHRSGVERFAGDVPATLREKQAAEPGVWDEVALMAPNEVFDDSLVVELGWLTLTLHHVPGHTPDSIVGFVPERGVLLMGDAAETPLPVVPDGSPVGQWIAGLQRWASDPRVRSVIPAHGAMGGREILDRNIHYLQGLLDGRPIEVDEPLTPFYRDTHAANVRATRLVP
jgi:glyoxylase-like metal-dependent hydrolase (beta-lactamase superfamily II)